jgi:hypothetical protein
MKFKALPPADLLNQMFDVNHETGVMTWRDRPIDHFTSEHGQKIFNTKYSGRVAGTLSRRKGGRKYLTVNLGKKQKANHFLAHRIVWTIMNGAIPCGMDIDHINGNGIDNRPENLRLASRSENLCNTGRRSRRTMMPRGVYYHRQSGLYRAEISVSGKTISLGYYKLKSIAAVVRAKAAIRHHGAFARFN